MLSNATKKFWKAFDKLDETVQKQARASYELFKQEPRHPSLHFKQVHNTLSVYSVRVNLNHRALGIVEDNTVIWFWIGPHDEYEKIISRL